MIKRQKDKMKQTYQQPTIGIEEAEAYKRLNEEFGQTQEKIAAATA